MAPSSSVPSSCTGEFELHRRLRRWLAAELRALRPVVEASAAACSAEHSRKHVTSYQHLSLDQGYEHVAACGGLVAASGLGRTDGTDRLGVNYSHLAASNGTRPAAL